MIFRKWSGRIRTADTEEYVQYIRDTGGAHYVETPGNLGYQILIRRLTDGITEVSTLSWWSDLDAVRRFAGEDYERATYYPEDDRFLVERTEFVEHHEVVDSDLNRALAQKLEH
jgi:heme-degrading monooxygenase HmoA